jgi:hypothetical protein
VGLTILRHTVQFAAWVTECNGRLCARCIARRSTNFFLAILRSGYREFERHVDSASPRPAKSDLVRRTILDQVGQFTPGDLAHQCPAASQQLIKKILSQLKSEGKVRLSGRGRGAAWEVTG